MYLRYGTIREITRRMTDFNKSILIENLIYEIYSFWMDETAEIITKEIDKLYVCYMTKKGLLYYKDKMNREEYDFLSLYENGFICSYILLTPRSVNNIRYIRFCQSIVSGLGIMYPFIEKVENITNRLIIPRDCIEDAVPYWKIFFKKKYGISTISEYTLFIQQIGAQVSLKLYNNNNIEG